MTTATNQHERARERASAADRENGLVTVYRVEHKDTLTGPYQQEGPYVDDVMKLYGHEADGPQPTASLDIPTLLEWSFDAFDRAGLDRRAIEWSLALNGGRLPKEIRFAFRRADQLERWFGDSFASLARAGYVIGEYRVPADWLVDGFNQVAYMAPYAERIRSLPLASIDSDASSTHKRTAT